MIKIVCIDNSEYPWLNLGKVYDAEFVSFYTLQKNLFILKGYPETEWYEPVYFVELEEYREKKLQTILDN
jgi:hypothetical protein